MKGFALADVVVRSRRVWLWGASVAFTLINLMTLLLDRPSLLLCSSVGLQLAALALYLRWRLERSGRIEVDDENVLLNGKALVKRARIRDGYVSKVSGRYVVHLASRGVAAFVDPEVVTASEEDARSLLAVLRLDRTHRAARLKVLWGTSADFSKRVALLLIASVVSGLAVNFGLRGLSYDASPLFVAAAIALGALAPLIAAFRSMVTVTIGADGVHLAQWLSRPRFVRYDEIERVDQQGTSMTIHLRHGPPLRLHMGNLGARADKGLLGLGMEERMQSAASQIEEAKRASEGGASVSAVLVARNGRDAAAWMRALAASHDAAASYRAAALAPETLWRIVDDAAASATARAGAAVALRARIDDEGRQRLRVASEACAAPALRGAFAAAADAGDEVVEHALASVEDETDSLRARAIDAFGK